MLIVDAMNVIGAVPDGWWKDRDAALARLVEQIVAAELDEWVVVIADGRPPKDLRPGTRGQVELRFAQRSGPDAADDDIVALVAELAAEDDLDDIAVVSSDRGVRERCGELGLAQFVGARTFRHTLARD